MAPVRRRGRRAAAHRRGDPAGLVALRPSARPRAARCARSSVVRRSPSTARAATSPASSWSASARSGGLRPAHPSPTRWSSWRAGPIPGLRAMVAHAVLEAGDPDTAYSLLGEPAPPGRQRVLRARRPLPAGAGARRDRHRRGDPRRAGPDHGVRRAGGHLRHRRPPRRRRPLPRVRVRRPGRPTRALEHARAAVVLNEKLQCLPWKRRCRGRCSRGCR